MNYLLNVYDKSIIMLDMSLTPSKTKTTTQTNKQKKLCTQIIYSLVEKAYKESHKKLIANELMFKTSITYINW